MRTVTFKSVIDGALARMGLDPLVTPSSNTLAAFTEYANSSVRIAWEMYPWPEAVRFESRQFYPSWSSTAFYAANDVVMGSDGSYYYAKQASTAQDPVADTADNYWAPASAYTSTTGSGILYAISLDQILSGVVKTPIGEVIGVFQGDPRTNRYSTPVNWMLTNDGIVVGQNGITVSSIPSTVWVQFCVRPSTYTPASYTNGDTVPYVIAEAVKHLICGAAQREDGQFEKGSAMEQLAESCLQVEWDKIEMKQGQQGRFGAMNR